MLAKFSVKKPYTVIVAILLVILLGVISFMNMTTDLLPSMDLPYVIVYTGYTGATPEAVEDDVTRPLEAAFATLTDVKSISSTSSENLSLVVLEFAAGADMNTAMIEINSEVEQLSGGWDDAIGSPVIMKLNPDMLPVTISTVSLEDADLLELSDYVQDELIAAFEAVDGVASVTPSGILTQQVDITIEQSRIDVLNNAILAEVDDELAEVERELRSAMGQISSGKGQLSRARSSTYAQIDEALAAIDQGGLQLPTAIENVTLQKAELSAQLEQARAALARLEGLSGLTDEEKAQMGQVAQALAALQEQKARLQAQMDALEESEPSDALLARLAGAQAAREEQLQLKNAQEQFISDLQLLDADSLKATIAQLESDIAVNEAEISTVRGDLENAILSRDGAARLVADLSAQVDALATPTPAPTATPEPTQAPTENPTEAPIQETAAQAGPEPTPEAPAETAPEASPENSEAAAPEITPEAPAETAAEDGEAQTAAPEATTETPAEITAEPTADVPVDVPLELPAEDVPAEDNAALEIEDIPAEIAVPEENVSEAPVEPADQPSAEAAPAEPASEPAAVSEPAPAAEPAPETESAPQEAGLLENLLGGSAQAEETTLAELLAQLEQARADLASWQEQVDLLSVRHDALRETLNDQASALTRARESLAVLEEGEITVLSRIEAAQAQIDACNARIAELDEEIEALNAQIQSSQLRDTLQAQMAQLDGQIAAILESDAYKAWLLISDSGALEGQYAQAQAAVAQLEAAIATMDEMLEKLNAGILPGGLIQGVDQDTDLAASRLQLAAARSQASSAFGDAAYQLNQAEKELNSAWKEFTDARDEALENAGIDGIITVETISGILGSQNLDLPAGYVSNAEDRYLVSVGTEFASLEELKQLKLFSLGMENVDDVRLLDVASVEISDNSADLFTLVNGENGIMLSFEKQSTASTAEVAENITAEAERLMAANPRLHITEMMNQGDYINLIIDSVLDNLVSGGLLAIAILLLFLLDWRPTLIVALSIPASVVVAFVCMYFTGITLNVMSLSGLAMGVGMLVDNSIVAIENIYRLKDEEGLPILTASIRGVNQVAGALFASTLTTICVFLPVVFVEGMARDLFSDMGLTIAFSLLASLVVAMTVVPSFAAGLFKKSKPRKQRFFSGIQRAYAALLRGALKVKFPVLLLCIALLAFSVVQLMDMPISFMPEVNSEQMSASLSFSDPDLPEAERQAIAVNIMEGMLDVQNIVDVSLSGSDSTSLMGALGGASDYSYYMLVEPGIRTNAEIADDIRAMAAPWADGETVTLDVQTSTMDLSMMAGSGISINISGEKIEDLRATAVEIAALMQNVPGIAEIDDGAANAEPKMIITVDKELANDNSLSVAQVYQYIAQRLYGAIELTSANLDGRDYSIYVSEDRNENLSPEDIQDMEIEVAMTDETRFVRIGDIATVRYGESMSSISRAAQQRTTAVALTLAEGASANLVSRDVEAVLEGYVPRTGVKLSLSGENETIMGYMEDLVLMLAVAVAFIFLIMVAQFQSFKSPFIVMFTIPLAFTGGLLALIITKMDLSIVAMLGFLVLSGVVVNNGIVFVDSVNQMRIEGMSKRDALIETGRIRLRPILMTALTTILGMSTMAFATGMGAEMMQPMAVVIVGGLLYSTLMTLFIVPVLYDMFNGEKMKAREIEMMKEAAGMAREGFDDGAAPAATPAAQKPAPAAEPAPARMQRSEEAPAPAPRPAPSPEDRARRIRIRL